MLILMLMLILTINWYEYVINGLKRQYRGNMWCNLYIYIYIYAKANKKYVKYYHKNLNNPMLNIGI